PFQWRHRGPQALPGGAAVETGSGGRQGRQRLPACRNDLAPVSTTRTCSTVTRARSSLRRSVARQGVEAQGGWIPMQSAPEEGSKFRIELPLTSARRVALGVRDTPARVPGRTTTSARAVSVPEPALHVFRCPCTAPPPRR